MPQLITAVCVAAAAALAPEPCRRPSAITRAPVATNSRTLSLGPTRPPAPTRAFGLGPTRRAFGLGLPALGLGLLAPVSADAYFSAGVDGDDVGAVETAYFAGGDARLLAPAFDAVRGVIASETGSMNDGTRAVKITYDPTAVTYGRLLGQFWRAVDPTTPQAEGQFSDVGFAYRTAVFPTDRRERDVALTSLQRLEELGVLSGRVATEITRVPFSGANAYGFVEDTTQDWAKKHKDEYAKLLEASGRSAYFRAVYGSPVVYLPGGNDPWPSGTFSALTAYQQR